MNLRDLKYIVSVAELGHFGRAAELCYVSQPALSAQIAKLENELNVTLFERSRRSVQVTPEGEQIIAYAKSILSLAEEIKACAQAAANPYSGKLRLGMIPTIGPYLTPSLLPAMKRSLPQLELDIVESKTIELEKSLLEGHIDAAILATKVEHSHLAEIFLYDEPFWVALPHQHPLALLETIDVNSISTEEFLLLEDGHCFRDQVISFCETALQANPNFKTQQTSLTTILSLVGSGSGVTLVPAMSLAGTWVTDAGIATRKEATGSAVRSVSLAYRKTYPRHRLLDRFADIICAGLPDTVKPARR